MKGLATFLVLAIVAFVAAWQFSPAFRTALGLPRLSDLLGFGRGDSEVIPRTGATVKQIERAVAAGLPPPSGVRGRRI